jgi:hypothetical protein
MYDDDGVKALAAMVCFFVFIALWIRLDALFAEEHPYVSRFFCELPLAFVSSAILAFIFLVAF